MLPAGYWLGAGWLEFGRAPCVCFGAAEKSDWEYLDGVLARLPVPFCRREQPSGDEQRVFVISTQAWVTVFAEEYHSEYAHGEIAKLKSAKWLAYWATRSLSAAQCRCVLDGLRIADGEAHDRAGGAIYTSSERLRDEVVQLALHAGFAAHYTPHQKAGWQVEYSTDDQAATPRLTVAEECCERTYTGRVWCVTVPSELVMFRRAWMEDGLLLASRPVVVGNTKQFIRYLISSNIGEVACIFLTAMIGMPEALIPVQLLWVNLVTDGLPATALGFNPPDKDIMLKPPRGRTESIINRWMFFRYVAVGLYVGIGTVGGFIWWFLYSSNGPHMTWAQLTDFHSCDTAGEQFTSMLARGVTCDVFHDPRPSTVSLSILVTIEMFNALNALSENQSLLVVTPLSNLYVVLACVLSFLLHITIVYVPFLAQIFHVAPLNTEEWLHVLYLSAPVLLLDEVLKAISRNTTGTKQTAQRTREAGGERR